MNAPALNECPAVTVTFEDHGQDFLEWDIKDGVIVGCRPFQASIWCGMQVHGTPVIGQKIQLVGNDGELSFVKYPVVKVEPITSCHPSKTVLNSKVVTKGAKALLAVYRKGQAS